MSIIPNDVSGITVAETVVACEVVLVKWHKKAVDYWGYNPTDPGTPPVALQNVGFRN